MRPAQHRHSAPHEHEHEFEPVRGLPEALPAGEHILWQGAPDWRALAVRAFHLRKLAVYFAGLLALRALLVVGDGGSGADALRSLLLPGPLALIGLGLVAVLAWLSARTTAYTVTNRRVVMRVGIVLTLTFNLPYRRIASAAFSAAPGQSGDIALTLSGRDRIAWMHLWPHARPWQLARPQPMLRCVPEGHAVATLLAQAWSDATGHEVAAPTTAAAPVMPAPATPVPALARTKSSPPAATHRPAGGSLALH